VSAGSVLALTMAGITLSLGTLAVILAQA
jgi:hypothetical protein